MRGGVPLRVAVLGTLTVPPRVAVLGTLTVPLLAGCTLFGFPPYFPGDHEVPSPSIAARYTTGSATIEIDDGTVITLDRLAPGSVLDAAMGASIRWSGGDGWHLSLHGAGASDDWGSYEYLQFDRVFDSNHWMIWDGSTCAVDVDQVDEEKVVGTASCRGLQWIDALGQGLGEPQPLDEPEFDAEVTFEAIAEGTSSSG